MISFDPSGLSRKAPHRAGVYASRCVRPHLSHTPLVLMVQDIRRYADYRLEEHERSEEDARRAHHVSVRDPGEPAGAREGRGRQGRRRSGEGRRAAADRRAWHAATSCWRALRAPPRRCSGGRPPTCSEPTSTVSSSRRTRRPTELVGENVTRAGETKFVQGTIFTNVLLADEINRTPPRTQAALLEAMAERSITVEGRVHRLPDPFLVIATQNPFEQEGVFPLPESNLDRFLFKIYIDYTDLEHEVDMLRLPHTGVTPDMLGEIMPLLGDRRSRQGPHRARRHDRARGGGPLRGRRRPQDAGPRGRHARSELARGDPPDERDQGERASRGARHGDDRGRPHDGAVRAASPPDLRGRAPRPGRRAPDGARLADHVGAVGAGSTPPPTALASVRRAPARARAG